jgi:ParB-like chromosome segregation protein Spo0J
MSWQNRIIGHGEESPDQLLANPSNWRIHPRAQQDALATVLDSVGLVQSVVVNRRSGFVVDGHLRVAMALRSEQASIPVTYVDLSDEEERLVLASLDSIGAMAVPDKEKLAELLEGIDREDATIDALVRAVAEDYDVGELPDFKEYGEDAADDVEYLECPECHHRWPK